MLQVQRLPPALTSLPSSLPSPRSVASHFRPPAAPCACIYECCGNSQQNNNKMIIFRPVSICPQTPTPPSAPQRFPTLLFIAFSFIKWKIADSIVCYLLPFWYETFFTPSAIRISIYTQAHTHKTHCALLGGCCLPTLAPSPSPAAPRPLPTCPAVIKGTTNDLFLPCFINIKCLTMTRAAPVLYEWINICLVLSARTLALALMINIQLAAFALIAIFRLFIAVFVDLYAPFAL